MWLTDGQTDGQTDRQTDERTPYHNTSEVSLRAYNNKKNYMKLKSLITFL